ncbi:MAG: M23 family metallopeptidase [Dehalococcoidia bacterium]
MLRHPWLHTLLGRLRSRRLGWDHLALTVAVGAGALLIGVGLVVLAVTWRDSRLHRPDADGGGPAVVQATASPNQAGATGDAGSGANGDEVARRLAEAPTERWAYALRAADRRPPPSLRPGNDPLAGSDPHPAPPVTQRVVPVVPASALGFAWPLNGAISSPFGDEHPLGIDIAPVDPAGLVLAARDGTVLYAGGDPCCSYGYYVILDHGDGLTSIYGHFREPPYVEAGERLVRGTVLGVAGDTGHSFGVHLHFEVRLNGIPVDPQQVLTGGQLTPLPVRIPPRPSPTPEPSPVPVPVYEPTPSPPAPLQAHDLGRVPAPTEAPADPTAAADNPTPTPETPAPVPSTPQPETPAPVPSTPEATATVQSTATATSTPPSVSTPTPTPSAATPAPTATATVPATPTATPSPSPTSTPTATPTPTPDPCETVRLAPPGQQPQAPPDFITLEATPDSVTSLIARRCAANEPAVVIAKPKPERNCMAVLADKTGAQSKRLIPVPQPTPTPGPVQAPAPPEIRWVIPPADLTPSAVLRVSCVEPATSLDP